MAAEIKSEQAPLVSHGRVAKNMVIYLGGQILSWAVSFVSISIVPRHLGERGMGEYTVASTAIGTAAMLFMLGIDSYLTKEVGRDRVQAQMLLRATFGLRLCLIPFLVVVGMGMLYAIHGNATIWLLGMLYILAASMTFFSEPMRASLVGWEQAKHVSVLDIAGALPALVAIPFLAYGPISITLPSVIFTALILVVRVVWVRRNVRLRPLFDVSIWKQLARGGLAFVANNLVIQLYAFATVFMLRYYAGDATVGVYSQAYKLFGTFLFIPTALGTALLPSLARLADAAPAEFRRMQARILGLLIVLGLPVSTLVILLASPLCHLLYGPHKFVALPPVLQVYALAIIPMYIVTTMYQFLVAQGRNGIWSLFLLATVGLYVLFSALLIPLTLRRMHNGAVGAVTATFLAESCSACFAIILLRTNPFNAESLGRIVRALLATAGMALAMWVTRGFFLLVPAVVGCLSFIALCVLLRILTPEEQARLVGFVRRKLRRRSVSAEA